MAMTSRTRGPAIAIVMVAQVEFEVSVLALSIEHTPGVMLETEVEQFSPTFSSTPLTLTVEPSSTQFWSSETRDELLFSAVPLIWASYVTRFDEFSKQSSDCLLMMEWGSIKHWQELLSTSITASLSALVFLKMPWICAFLKTSK